MGPRGPTTPSPPGVFGLRAARRWHNQPLLWTGPRRVRMLSYSSARLTRRVAGHRASSVMPLYHAVLTCKGLTEAEGADGAADVAAGFRERPWHQNVACRWDGTLLWLEADNDYDSDGRALSDEFWDEVIANVNFSGSISFAIVSVRRISVGA